MVGIASDALAGTGKAGTASVVAIASDALART
jgi:hypothetical protein